MNNAPHAAATPADLPSQTQLLSMSGLEFMQGILSGRLAGAPIARALNFQITRVTEGEVEFHGTPEFAYANPMGSVHGGWYGTILDSAMGCAVMTRVPRGSVYTTLEYKVNILRPIPMGTVVACIGTCQHAGRSTGVAVGEIRGLTDGRLYATGSTTCIIMAMAGP